MQLQVVADSLELARTVRPGCGRKQGSVQASRDTGDSRATETATAGEDLDEEIPF